MTPLPSHLELCPTDPTLSSVQNHQPQGSRANTARSFQPSITPPAPCRPCVPGRPALPWYLQMLQVPEHLRAVQEQASPHKTPAGADDTGRVTERQFTTNQGAGPGPLALLLVPPPPRLGARSMQMPQRLCLGLPPASSHPSEVAGGQRGAAPGPRAQVTCLRSKKVIL